MTLARYLLKFNPSRRQVRPDGLLTDELSQVLTRLIDAYNTSVEMVNEIDDSTQSSNNVMLAQLNNLSAQIASLQEQDNLALLGMIAALQARTLDAVPAPMASVDFNGKQALQFVIENRTSDPSSPVTGQIWMRTDL